MTSTIRRVLLVLSVLVVSSTTCAESLVTIDTRILPVCSAVPRYPTINALQLGGDTLVVGSWEGVWIQCEKTQDWRKLIDVIASGDWMVDCHKKKVYQHLYIPKPLWRIPDSDIIVVYECFCDAFLKLPLGNRGERTARIWWTPQDDGFSAFRMNAQQDLVLVSLWSDDSLLIGLAGTTEPGLSRRIFKFTPPLGEYLDSLWLSWANGRPAFNPADSTIWFSIHGYHYVYILDMDGNLLDSVRIAASDFSPPQPPVSRIQSDAVYQDWVSRWTPQTDFRYVPPGYFLLQYRTGWTKLTPEDSIRLLSTCAWNDQGQPVELDVDSNWAIAGVHDDGRLVFGHYEEGEDQNKIVLNITRIEP